MLAVKPPVDTQPSAAQQAAPSNLSAAQLAANVVNAQHSTGPKTPEGKARVSQNALKHGLYSRASWEAAPHVGEDPADFDVLLEGLLTALDPQDPSECVLVHRMAGLTWRLARVHRAMEGRLAYFCSKPMEPSVRNFSPYSLYGGLREAAGLLPMETHLSRELSRVQRDLAFSQRYRHANAERAAERDAKREMAAHSSMDDVMAALHAESSALLAASRLRYAANPEPAEVEDDRDADQDVDGSDAIELNNKSVHGSTPHQSLSFESEEQTQSEASETPPKVDDGSIDLT